MGDMNTQTITEFLEARIAEDEAAAKHRDVVTFGPERRKFANDALSDPHDPARVLAECTAKRAITRGHRRVADLYEDALGDTCTTCADTGPDAQDFPCDTLRILAAVYADHADYQQEWSL